MNDRRILIVDDDERIRELVQACLEDLAGWETLTVACGEECLQILETEKVNVVLLDVSMPGMDGVTVYEKLRANIVTQSVPVILLTAKVLPSDRAKFAQMSVAGVISKPIQPAALVAEVTEILGWDE